MKRMVYPVFLILLVSQLGCGEKISDVLKKYEDDFQKKRDQFRSIANSLPPKGSPRVPCTSFNPPLQFNEKTKQFNAEMIMYEQLLDPDAEPQFDLVSHGDLLNGMRWTGPKSPLSSSVLSNSGKDMDKSLQEALDYRYLIVNRVSELVEPVAIDEKTFSPGHVNIETFVVDLSSNKPLCNFVIEGKSAANVTYSFKQGESKEEQLRKFAHSTVWEEAHRQLSARLKAVPNSNVELD